MDLFNNIQAPWAVFSDHGVEEVHYHGPVHEAQDLGNVRGPYGPCAEGEGLVQEALGVPEAPVRLPRDGEERIPFKAYPLLIEDLLEVPLYPGKGDAPEVKALAPGEYGEGDLVDLGCGEYEYRVGRGLFEGL